MKTDSEMLAGVVQTYHVLTGALQNMPGAKMEDLFPNRTADLNALVAERDWIIRKFNQEKTNGTTQEAGVQRDQAAGGERADAPSVPDHG